MGSLGKVIHWIRGENPSLNFYLSLTENGWSLVQASHGVTLEMVARCWIINQFVGFIPRKRIRDAEEFRIPDVGGIEQSKQGQNTP